jgi:hypothetical protein
MRVADENRSPAVETYADALLAPTAYFQPDPEHPGRQIYDGGAHMANGTPIEFSKHSGSRHRNVLAPLAATEPSDTLPGTWLYGGLLRDHFGHFVNESVGRLWAWKLLNEQPSGIVFLPYGAQVAPDAAARRADYPILRAVLDLLGIRARVVAPTSLTQVERLIVPEQLLFHKDRAHPARREVLHRMFRDLAAGPVALDGLTVGRAYISRSRLGIRAGRFLLESVIEENFARAGYAIIHPERLPLAAQVAVYRGLTSVVFAEGSALHLAAPLLPKAARVGVIWRGRGAYPPMRGLLHACGFANVYEHARPLGFLESLPPETPGAEGQGQSANLRNALTLLDFERLGDELAEAGFVSRDTWRIPDAREIAEAAEAALKQQRQLQRRSRHSWVGLPDPVEQRATA